jgi:branched-chain amino acid transport system ATP-binding protein
VSDPAALTVEDMAAGYGGVLALRSVSITAPPATITAVLGANGAGKTTRLRAISGVIRPRRGRVLVSGQDVTGRSAEDMARTRGGARARRARA